MENSLSIQNVLNQKENYNLALPFAESQQVNPYYKMRVALVYADTNPNASEIYKVGSKRVNNRYIDLYALTKPFLQRLASEAGIKFAAGSGDVVRVDENTWKASAFGMLRLPDNDMKTLNDSKVIDLVTEERKYRLSYQEKAVQGISEERAAQEASKKYSGVMKDGVFYVSDQDKDKYIERSVLEAMAQLRSSAPQKAATGAILRVIRGLLGLKNTYTMEELKKPFAVARMSFSPDYNDPMVKQMMLQQCMQSVWGLFGNTQPVMQTISIPQNTPDEEISVEAEPEVPQALPEAHNEETAEDRTNDFQCSRCGSIINERVYEYSINKFGEPLCIKCQRGGRR